MPQLSKSGIGGKKTTCDHEKCRRIVRIDTGGGASPEGLMLADLQQRMPPGISREYSGPALDTQVILVRRTALELAERARRISAHTRRRRAENQRHVGCSKNRRSLNTSNLRPGFRRRCPSQPSTGSTVVRVTR